MRGEAVTALTHGAGEFRWSSAAALLFVSIMAFAIALGSAAEGETAPLGILLVAALLPFGAIIATQALTWNGAYAFAVGIVLITLQCATLRVREIEDKSIDFQILIKLGCIASMIVLATTALMRHWPIKALPELILWIAFFVYLVFTAALSVRPEASFVETVSNISAFIYVYGVYRIIGARNLASMMVAACFVLCCMSLVAYAVKPDLGRMADWVGGAFIPTSRLTGVFGTANAAGAAGALGILLTALFSGVSPRRPLFYVIILPMVACLLASNNRMSIAALAVSFGYVWLASGKVTAKLVLMLFFASLAALVMASFSEKILELLSRSGSADEILSGTGRTRIWLVVLEMWTERPLFGYGAGSAKYILPFHPMLFKAAAHAHNMYLSILFSGGAVGLSIFLVSLTVTLRRCVLNRNHKCIGLILFFLLYGITEPTIGGVVSFLSLSFYTALVLSLAPPSTLRPSETSPAASPFRFAPYRNLSVTGAAR